MHVTLQPAARPTKTCRAVAGMTAGLAAFFGVALGGESTCCSA